jgi:predicted nucleic acid-binding protein
MSGKVFLDTNILIYAAASNSVHPAKFARAEEIVAGVNFGISTQVVGEFVRNVQNPKKISPPLSDVEVDAWVERLFEFPVIEVDREVVESAILIQKRYGIGFWDGQILAAAHRFGADTLYSEDLGDGQLYGSVRCENPFRNRASN